MIDVRIFSIETKTLPVALCLLAMMALTDANATFIEPGFGLSEGVSDYTAAETIAPVKREKIKIENAGVIHIEPFENRRSAEGQIAQIANDDASFFLKEKQYSLPARSVYLADHLVPELIALSLQGSVADMDVTQTAITIGSPIMSSDTLDRSSFLPEMHHNSAVEFKHSALDQPLEETLPGRVLRWVFVSLGPMGPYKILGAILFVSMGFGAVKRMFTKRA